MRLVAISLRKVTRRPAVLRTGLVLALLMGFVYLAVGASARALPETEQASIAALLAFPGAYTELAGVLATFAGLAGAALGGAIAGSEWSWGTYRVAVARGVSRGGYVLGLAVALSVLAFVGFFALYLVGLVFVVVGNAVSGIGLGDPLGADALTRVPLVLAAGWLAIVMQTAIGFAVAFATRSQVAGIVVVVGLFFAEQFAVLIAPLELMRLAPITGANTLISTAGQSGMTGELVLPIAVTGLYLAAALVGAVVVARRAEVA
jgi:ABC-type transport system involved in multi-copper enzyme maturation permease subunit